MGKKIKNETNLIPIDNSDNELFESLNEIKAQDSKKSLSYIPSFFTTASLPFKNINRTEFIRKASNGILIIKSNFNYNLFIITYIRLKFFITSAAR